MKSALQQRSGIWNLTLSDAFAIGRYREVFLSPGHQSCSDFGTWSQLRSEVPRNSWPQRTLRSSPSNFGAFRTLTRISRMERQECRLRKSWRCDNTCGHTLHSWGSSTKVEVTEGVRRRSRKRCSRCPAFTTRSPAPPNTRIMVSRRSRWPQVDGTRHNRPSRVYPWLPRMPIHRATCLHHMTKPSFWHFNLPVGTNKLNRRIMKVVYTMGRDPLCKESDNGGEYNQSACLKYCKGVG